MLNHLPLLHVVHVNRVECRNQNRIRPTSTPCPQRLWTVLTCIKKPCGCIGVITEIAHEGYLSCLVENDATKTPPSLSREPAMRSPPANDIGSSRTTGSDQRIKVATDISPKRCSRIKRQRRKYSYNFPQRGNLVATCRNLSEPAPCVKNGTIREHVGCADFF